MTKQKNTEFKWGKRTERRTPTDVNMSELGKLMAKEHANKKEEPK